MSFAAAVLSRLPRGLGDRRTANALYRRFYAGKPRTVQARLHGGAQVRLDLSDWPQAQAFLLRRYDPATVQFIVDHLPERGVFIDAGSHIGLVSVQVSNAKPGAQIHTFDPLERNAARVREHARQCPSLFTVNHAGLSDRAGELRFSSQWMTVTDDGDIRVPVVALDDYLDEKGIERVDVLKLDVEGHELAALHGARRALEAGRIRAVTLETLHGDAAEPLRFLERLGYQQVPMPDPRPKWLASRRPAEQENVGYTAPGT